MKAPSLTDIDYVLDMFSINRNQTKAIFRDSILSSEDSNEKIGFENRKHIKDCETLILIKDTLGSENTALLC